MRGGFAEEPTALRERRAELVVLGDVVRGAAAGAGRLVLVRGAAGLGKTRLLDAAAELAADAGLAVLRADGTEIERALPFGAALALLERRLREADPAERAALLAGPAQRARPLLDGAEAGAAPDRLLVLVHALHWVLVHLAERRPLVLLVDDAHWVDPASLRLLLYLGRRVGDLPLAVVVAARPAEPGAEVDLLADMAASSVLLEPAPLSADATVAVVRELLPVDPAPAFLHACSEVTGGNPLLIRELARGLAEAGVAGSDAAAVRTVGPRPVAWSVRATLRRLPPEATGVAHALSVLGDDGDLDAAVRVAGADPARAAAAVTALEHAGVLAGGAALRFTHPLLRQAVAASMADAERAQLHLRAARLRAAGGRKAEASAHLLLAPPGGGAWAVDALVAAAAQAGARGAPARAAELLRRALAEPDVGDRRGTVLGELARAEAAMGAAGAAARFAEAIDATDDDADRAALLLGLAWEHQARGRFADAVRAAERGIALDAGGTDLRIELLAMRDAARVWTPGPAEQADRRPVPAGPAGSHAERVALADAARRRMFAGQDAEAAADLARRAWDDGAFLADSTADDPAAVRVLTVLHNADLQAEALAVAEACLEDARRRAAAMTHATWRHLRGHVHAYAGRLDEAEADLRAAFAAREQGWGAFLPVTVSALAYLLIERDDLDGAEAVLAAGDQDVVHPRRSPMWTLPEVARGRLQLERGEAALAEATLSAAGRRAAEELGTDNPALSPWRADAALALHRMGRTADALALAEVDLAGARAWGAPRAVGTALRVHGIVGARLDPLRLAVQELDGSEARLDLAHALLALGLAERAAEDAEAVDTLRAALDQATRCGAHRPARLAREALLAAGARPRRAQVTGPASLTAREREVAGLVATGRTNRAVAEELFVTPKAVAYHLGNVYRKLGIEGRAELAGALTPEQP